MKNKKNLTKKTGGFSILKNYKKSFQYIYESRNFIYSVIAIFTFFVILAAFIPIPDMLEQKILQIIGELLEKIQGMSMTELISFIFFNNLKSSFLGLFLGIFFGFFSLMTSIVNGYILGFVMAKSVEVGGFLVIWKLLPHGIFELPALFISLGLGLRLGSFIFKEKKAKTLKKYLIESFRSFVFVVIPLLIIAAIIEGSLIFLFGKT